MQANSNKKKRKAGQQLALFGDTAFDPDSDCEVCKGRLGGRTVHQAHHKLCPNNRRTKGIASEATLQQMKIDESFKKHFNTPLPLEERASSRHLTKEAGQAFLPTRNPPTNIAKSLKSTTTMEPTKTTGEFLAESFCREVMTKLNNKPFVEAHANGRAPLAMLAFAAVVAENIVRDKEKIFECFQDLTLQVPPCKDMHDNPCYDSIVGQKLLDEETCL